MSVQKKKKKECDIALRSSRTEPGKERLNLQTARASSLTVGVKEEEGSLPRGGRLVTLYVQYKYSLPLYRVPFAEREPHGSLRKNAIPLGRGDIGKCHEERWASGLQGPGWDHIPACRPQGRRLALGADFFYFFSSRSLAVPATCFFPPSSSGETRCFTRLDFGPSDFLALPSGPPAIGGFGSSLRP